MICSSRRPHVRQSSSPLMERLGDATVASPMRAAPTSFEPESAWNEWLQDAGRWVEESTMTPARALITRESVCEEFDAAATAMGQRLRLHMEQHNLESVQSTGMNYKVLQKHLAALQSAPVVSPESLQRAVEELRAQLAADAEMGNPGAGPQPSVAWEFGPLH